LDEVVKIVLSIVFAGGIVSFIDGAQGIALAMTISDALCVLVLAILFFIAGGRFTKPSGFKELIVRTVPLSATRIITSLATSLTAVVIPQMLVRSGMTVAAATAEYGRVAGMALPLIMAPVMFVSSLSVVLIPDVAELRAKGAIDEVRKKLSGAMTFAMLIASVFFVIYLPLGRQIGNLFFGDDHAGTLVSNCSFMLFPIAIAQVTTPMLNSLGKERATFFATLAGALSTLPCIFLLPQAVGVYAMAIASAVCFALISIINIIILKKEVGSFADIKKFAKTLAFSVPLAVLGMFSSRLLSRIAGNLVTTIVMIIFLVFFLFIFINAFEIADITGYIRMLRPTNVFARKTHRKNSKAHNKCKTEPALKRVNRKSKIKNRSERKQTLKIKTLNP